MKVDTGVMAPSLSDIGPRARELEELGYDGLLTAETGHDAFLPIALAAEHTERTELIQSPCHFFLSGFRIVHRQ